MIQIISYMINYNAEYSSPLDLLKKKKDMYTDH